MLFLVHRLFVHGELTDESRRHCYSTTLKLTDPCLRNGEVSVLVVRTGALVHANSEQEDLSLLVGTRMYKEIFGVLATELVRTKSRTIIYVGFDTEHFVTTTVNDQPSIESNYS
jgi:hypothetical protein